MKLIDAKTKDWGLGLKRPTGKIDRSAVVRLNYVIVDKIVFFIERSHQVNITEATSTDQQRNALHHG